MARKQMSDEKKLETLEKLEKAKSSRAAFKESEKLGRSGVYLREEDLEEAFQKKEEKKETSGKGKSKADEIDALQKQVEELKKMLQTQQEQQAPHQIVSVASNSPAVHFVWMAPVADDNIVLFGEGGMYGRIVGKTGNIYIPKNDLSRIMDSQTQFFLKQRWLIAVSGLDEEEREALGVDYNEGEVLDKKAFGKLIELGDEILSIYPELCDGHKKIVEKAYYEAWTGRNPHVNRETVVALHRISDSQAFKAIIEGMNEEDISK